MKINKVIYMCIVLVTVFNLQYAHTQICTDVYYSTEDYDNEIDTRLQATKDILNSVSNIDLQDDPAGNPLNYVILNDRDFYNNNKPSYNDQCRWPLINYYGNNNSDPLTQIEYIILTPGDYRDYLTFYPIRANAAASGDKRYLLQYNGSPDDDTQVIENYLNNPTTAINQPEEERAIIENFWFKAEGNYSWVVRGITVRGNRNSRLDDENGVYGSGSSTSQIISRNNNVIEDCLFENQVVGKYIQLVNADNNIVNNCVIRNQDECMITYLAGNDIVGITIAATYNQNSSNNVIINNEAYNLTQAFQAVYGANNLYGECSGTFIYGNEFYNEKIFMDSCDEERMNGEFGIAFKCGSLSSCIADKLIVTENEFYGWRRSATEGLGRVFDEIIDGVPENQHPTNGDCEYDANGRGGGDGNAILCTFNAKNIAIYKNSISDCSNGISTASGGGTSTATEFIEIYNNVICDLYPSKDVYDANVYWEGTLITLPPGNTLPYNQYNIGHTIGTGINARIDLAKVVGNRVTNAIRGIVINTSNSSNPNPIEVYGNYLENIAYQPFRVDQPQPTYTNNYANYTNNYFYNSGYTYSGYSNTNPCSYFNDMMVNDNNNCFISGSTEILPCQ